MTLRERIRRWWSGPPSLSLSPQCPPLPMIRRGTMTASLIQFRRQKEAPVTTWDYPRILADQGATIAHLQTQLDEAAVDAREIRNLRWQVGDLQWKLAVAQTEIDQYRKAEMARAS